jgi:hypothetical protein
MHISPSLLFIGKEQLPQGRPLPARAADAAQGNRTATGAAHGQTRLYPEANA